LTFSAKLSFDNYPRERQTSKAEIAFPLALPFSALSADLQQLPESPVVASGCHSPSDGVRALQAASM
jgi:hypothetical protein